MPLNRPRRSSNTSRTITSRCRSLSLHSMPTSASRSVRPRKCANSGAFGTSCRTIRWRMSDRSKCLNSEVKHKGTKTQRRPPQIILDGGLLCVFVPLCFTSLKCVLQGELQDPHIPRGSDLAEELEIQRRKICRRNGRSRRNVRPVAVGHVIGLHAKLQPLPLLDSEVPRQRHVEGPESRSPYSSPVHVPDCPNGRLRKCILIEPERVGTARSIFVRIGQDLIGRLIGYGSSVPRRVEPGTRSDG